MRPRGWMALALAGYALAGRAVAAEPPDITLAAAGSAAPFLIEPGADPAVVRAAGDVCDDIQRVSGARPELLRSLPGHPPGTLVLAGIVGRSELLARLAAAGKIDLSGLPGSWETFVVAGVERPFPGVERALVVAGSDRRGAIYGLYQISEMIGVSPWYWWADVTPAKRSRLAVPASIHRFGPPSVKYRGIFINDEDWALRPWVEQTFDPAHGNFGPKTYAKVFELLLRLRANTLWPAMHPGSEPFNQDPENARLADAYGIVMGSSHAEPMLRNNVGEWKAPPQDYNYLTHPGEVRAYWEERLRANGRYENIYTLGMRGIHDSAMQGPKTDPARIRTLEQVITDQRRMIARYVNPDFARVPQIFCPYKEVMPLYREGLEVPGDVTLVWPDDNFGYVENFAGREEMGRPGGFGVYYHVSYLGVPLSYLWICTTPPALIWEEMSKSYDRGASRLWILNVGDIKPAEIDIEFFMRLAWNVRAWGPDAEPAFLRDWAARTFGAAVAPELSRLLGQYYLLNFQRKPEHLQWGLPGHAPRPSPLTDREVTDRLAAFGRLQAQAEALRPRVAPRLQDAFFELVQYPVVGSALANERYFEGERGDLGAAESADRDLREETRVYNDRIAGGKWRGMMNLDPASQWPSFQIAPWRPPAQARRPEPSPRAGTYISRNAAGWSSNIPRSGFRWTVVPGLGRTGRAVTVLPGSLGAGGSAPPGLGPFPDARHAPELDYRMEFPASGEFELRVQVLPTHPLDGGALRFAVALDDGEPQPVALPDSDIGPAWSQAVLDNVRIATVWIGVARPGPHVIRLYGLDPGVVVDRLVLNLGGLTPSYLGPPPDPSSRE